MSNLLQELVAQEEKLLNCVHCGFCLPACPTYNRLGDEADSPRGRLRFMGAVVEERLSPTSGAFQTHLDRCLGCRACESVCPSGVEYGRLLEGAREVAARARPPGYLTRLLPRIMASGAILAVLGGLIRALRGTGIPAIAARVLPPAGILRQGRLAMGMVAATAPWNALHIGGPRRGKGVGGGDSVVPRSASTSPRTVALLTGCVQGQLFRRVNAATARVLSANGFELAPAPRQRCCGALHAHSGDLEGARKLARENITAFEEAGIDLVVVNAAGCGAAMKEYGHLLSDDQQFAERASAFSARVVDILELLAKTELRTGGEMAFSVAYDAPCHLHHAQKIEADPVEILKTIPGLRLVQLAKPDECCGGAGIYGLTHPELGGQIGRDKVRDILGSEAEVVATGNPGCMMQIGAELRIERSNVGVVHPIELIDESYRRGGIHTGGRNT